MTARSPEIEHWTNATGESFRLVRYKSPTPAKLALFIHHGHGEHAARYQSIADGIGDLPVDIWAWDLRGHGESVGPRGDVAGGLDGYISDMKALFSVLFEKSGVQNAVLFGHSMGGAVVGRYLQQGTPDSRLVGTVLSSPAFAIERTMAVRLKLLVGKVLGKLVPTLTLPTGLSAEGISTDRAEQDRYKNDPLVHDKISAQLGVSLTTDGEAVAPHAARIRIPVLHYHGTADPITPISGSESFAKAMGERADYTFLRIDGVRHETHHDVKRAEVFGALRTFLETRIDALGTA